MKGSVFLGFLLITSVVFAQQPNWVVAESDYQYSMTLICKLNVNGRTLNSSNDKVGAFVTNELRGVSSPSYVSSVDDYYTYMTIFSNQQGETIRFLIYDSTTNTYHNVEMTLDFVANRHTGTLFQSVSIASPALNSEADISTIGFVDVPLNDSVREESNFTLYIPSIISKETLVASFTLSEGARAYINQTPQISGVSVVDFTNPVEYQILSQDESTLNTFTIEVIYSFDDYDGDGLEDGADLDDDNDCYADIVEEDLGTNPLDATSTPSDFNGDCIPDAYDTDGDGFLNSVDLDLDGDCYPNQVEEDLGTNPLDAMSTPSDSNGDCIPDAYDRDSDGILNDEDLDDDNDCFSDQLEEDLGTNPLDPNSTPVDIDGDCIADVYDPDTNNDGFVDNQIFVDEFFSPNGDGINDHWNIINIERFPSNQLWIYTRSGKLILSQSPYRNNWLGTYQGESLPEGNYYYQLDIEGDNSIDSQGWIYLSR